MGRRAQKGVLLLALALTGCAAAGQGPGPATSDSGPIASSSPTPTLEPVGGPGLPGEIAQGDCAALLTDDEAAAALGAEGAGVHGYRRDETAALLGGIQCTWVSEPYRSLTLTAFPLDLVPQDMLDSVGEGQCVATAGNDRCIATGIQGSIWLRLSGQIDGTAGPGGEGAQASEAFLAARTAALGRAAIMERGTPADRHPSWWSPPGCDTFAAEMGLPGLVGSDLGPAAGGDIGFPTDAEEIAARHGLWAACRWTIPSIDGLVEFRLQPGAGWGWDQVLATASERSSPVSIIGATAAVLVPPLSEQHRTYIYATDGTNVLRVDTYGIADPAVLVAGAFAALARSTG